MLATAIAALAVVACDKSRGTAGGGAASASAAASDASAPATKASLTIPPGPGKPRGPITTYDQAVAALRAAWLEEIAPPTATHSPKAFAHQSAVLAGRPPRARLMTCREAHKQASTSVAATKEGEDLGLFAAIPALDREGNCWDLVVSDAFAEIHAYFDAKTGAMVCAFLAPTG